MFVSNLIANIKQTEMKKINGKKQVFLRKQKLQIDKKIFEDIPEFFIPFGFSFLPDYLLVMNHRLYKGKHNNGKRNLQTVQK